MKKLPKPNFPKLKQLAEVPKHEEITKLELDIQEFYRNNQMSDAMHKTRAEYVRIISEYLKSDGITNQLEPEGISIHSLTAFGSFATQCASKDSDLDLCVCAASEARRVPAVIVLQAIHRDLLFNPHAQSYFYNHTISEITFVQTAKVPIIRFKINNIPVDLSSTFETNPPRTSLAAKFFNAYCQLDERFPILVTFLKTWLKSEGSADDHLRNYPNSYSIILMLIHVLQWYDVLPNLQETHSHIFHLKHFSDWESAKVNKSFKFPLDENTIIQHRMKDTSRLSVVELLNLFATHYSNVQMLDQYRLNMKSGDIELRPRGSHQEHPIQILDPYDKRNPARSARSSDDLVASTRELTRLLKHPTTDMYGKVMNITREKAQRYSMFPPHLMQYMMNRNMPPPLLPPPQPYQQWQQPYHVARNQHNFAPPNPYYPPQRYYTAPPLMPAVPMSSNYAEFPPLAYPPGPWTGNYDPTNGSHLNAPYRR